MRESPRKLQAPLLLDQIGQIPDGGATVVRFGKRHIFSRSHTAFEFAGNAEAHGVRRS